MEDRGRPQRAATIETLPRAHFIPAPDVPGQINALVQVSGGTIYGPVIGINQGSVHTELTIHTQAGTILNLAVAPTIERHPHKPRPPRPLRIFSDREAEQAVLLPELQSRHGAWVYGLAGCGVTALLNRIANLPTAQALADGIVWIEGRVEAPFLDDVVQRLFRRFYTTSIAVHIAKDEIETYLGDLQALFVLDALPLNRPDLVTLTNIVGSGAVLVAAEGPAPDTLLAVQLGGLPDHDARAFFATAAHIDSTAPEGAALLDQVCLMLKCLPLPLLLAAQLIQSQTLTFQQLVTALEQESSSSTLARAVGQGSPMSSQSVAPLMLPDEPLTRIARVVLMVLTTDEQAVLATLVRVGGYDADLAALVEISDKPKPTVECALARLSALRLVEGNAQRYTITSASLRRVLDRLLAPGAERSRAAAFFAATAVQHAGDLAWLGSERGNLMAAVETLLAEGQAAQAGMLARILQPSLVLRGQWGSWGQIIAWANQAAASANDPRLRAWALHERGTRAGLHDDLETAKTDLLEAQQLRTELGDRAGAAVSEHNLRYLGLLPPPPPLPRTRPRRPSPRRSRWVALTVLMLVVLSIGWRIVPPIVGAVVRFFSPASSTLIDIDSTPTAPPTDTPLPVPITPVPTTPVPIIPVPTTPVPTTPVPIIPVPTTPVPPIPVPLPAVTIDNVSIDPNVVDYGESAQGTVTLSRPAPTDVVITLSSSNSEVAEVEPTSVTIPTGATQAIFTVQTSRVAEDSEDTQVTITATQSGEDKPVPGSLTVLLPPPG